MSVNKCLYTSSYHHQGHWGMVEVDAGEMKLGEINANTTWGRPSFLSLSKLHTKLPLATCTEGVDPAGFGEDERMRAIFILVVVDPVPGVGRANLHNLSIHRNNPSG